MANICWYQVKVKGKRVMAQMVAHSIFCYDQDVVKEEGTDDDYTVVVSGNTAWALDARCKSQEECDINDFDLENLYQYPLVVMSRFFQCDIEAFSQYEDYDRESEAGDKPTYVHYRNGETIESVSLSYEDLERKYNETIGISGLLHSYNDDGDDWLAALLNDYDNGTESTYNYERKPEDAFPETFELVHSEINGGAQRAEKYKVGDAVEMTINANSDQYGAREEVIEVRHATGFAGYLFSEEAKEILKREDAGNLHATITSVTPLSKRSKRCKKPLVEVTITYDKEEAEAEAKKKAEEERIAKEEADRKAQEEARRQEEEKKRKEEAEKKQYEADMAAWKTQCSAVEEKRKAYIAERLAAEKKRLEETAKSKRDAAVASTEKEFAEQQKRKADAETTLASLGMFKFGEKKTQKAIIEDATKRIAEAESAKSDAESTFHSEMSAVSGKLSSKERSLKTEAEKKMPLPSEPQMPEFMKPAKPAMTATMTANQGYKQAILDFLSIGGQYTITDLMENVPEIADLSIMRVAAIVRQMVEDGPVIREEIKGKAYFSKV